MLGREQSVTVQEVMEEMMSGDFPPASLSRPFAASYQAHSDPYDEEEYADDFEEFGGDYHQYEYENQIGHLQAQINALHSSLPYGAPARGRGMQRGRGFRVARQRGFPRARRPFAHRARRR